MSVLLTVTGQNKFAAALAGGDPVNLTEFAVGDGGGDYYTLDESQTALVNETWRGDINRVYVDPTNLDQVVGEALIPAGVGGWTIREAGLFDADGDLIAVALYPLTEKPAPGSGSEKEIYARMVLQVTNGGSAVITVSQDLTMATLQDLSDHEAKQLDPTDTDETREKHLSNAQAHGWESDIAANAQAIADEATARATADSTHAALTSPHSATSAATASRLMVRDSSGRAKVAAPSASDDIARKNEVDAEATARASADSTHAALTSPHSATSAATASRLMVRDSSGRAKVAAPSASDDIARKNEVDAEATARASADSTHAALTAPHSASATATANRLALRDGSGRLEAAAGIASNDLVNFGQFGVSLAANGYQVLPSGLILQWGYAGPANSSSILTIIFPTTFPTIARFVSAMQVGFGGDNDNNITSLTASGATFGNITGGLYAYWFAIGY